jgi:signal transduction histidine kinase
VAAREARASRATEVAEILAGVAAEADEAIDALREFARGIYPPLLEAEGLGSALTAQARRLPLPVTVHASGVGRVEPRVEAAVYFSVLEALQNVVKHAQASSAHVALHSSDGELRFEVTDDGRGFDPALVEGGSGLTNLADRIDALGGAVEIDSSLGTGTTVRGTVPTRLREPAS